MLVNLKLGLIMAAISAALITGAYFKGRWDGSGACDARHAAAQIKQTEKTRKAHATVKKNAPDDIDKRLGIEWLLKHVRP